MPAYTGHRPLKTLNSDDLPHPLGPVMSRCSPGFIVSVRLGTTTSPLGVTIGTSYSDMLPSGLFFIIPVQRNQYLLKRCLVCVHVIKREHDS